MPAPSHERAAHSTRSQEGTLNSMGCTLVADCHTEILASPAQTGTTLRHCLCTLQNSRLQHTFLSAGDPLSLRKRKHSEKNFILPTPTQPAGQHLLYPHSLPSLSEGLGATFAPTLPAPPPPPTPPPGPHRYYYMHDFRRVTPAGDQHVLQPPVR